MKDIKINKANNPIVKFNPWDIENYKETGIYLTDEGLIFAHKEKQVIKYICSMETAEGMDKRPKISYLEVLVVLFALGVVMAIITAQWS